MKRNKKEQEFCTHLQKWLRHNYKKSAGIEVKVVNLECRKRLNYKAEVPEHQRRNLALVAGNAFIYKIPDDTISQKPFDIVKLSDAKGYLIVMFWKPGVKHFYMIEINKIINEINRDEKSLDEQRAAQLGERCVLS